MNKTPIQELSVREEGKNRFYIKRDDLLPVSFGGNKVRIALAFLEDMERKGCDALIAYGDRRSNLCRVLTSLCAQRRIPCLIIATSEHREESPSFNERIIRSYAPEVFSCEKDRVAETVDRAFEHLRSRGFRPYYIYGNRFGTGNEGVAAGAYALGYREIREQEAELGQPFDRIVTACGTGSTLGGLVAGSVECGDDPRRILGISISSRSRERALSVLAETVRSRLSESMPGGPAACPSEKDLSSCLKTEYNLGGYGLYDGRVRSVIRNMMRENSVPLDPVYTGKAFLGMLDYLRNHDVRGERILFLHTGGLPLFFDYLDSEGL